jgi:hypothetical protein
VPPPGPGGVGVAVATGAEEPPETTANSGSTSAEPCLRMIYAVTPRELPRLVAFAPLVAACLALVPSAPSGQARTISGKRTVERIAQERQLCVERWNATKMRWGGRNTIAIVRAWPCRLRLAYSFGNEPPRRRNHFRCRMNRFGADRCDSHAQGPGYDPGGWNATLRSYVMGLNHPPKHRLPFKPPPWALRYEIENGFIIPFAPDRRLRQGLHMFGHASGGCLGYHLGASYRTPRRCFGNDHFIRDPQQESGSSSTRRSSVPKRLVRQGSSGSG